MKTIQSFLFLFALVVLVCGELPVLQRQHGFRNWPAKSAKQVAFGRNPAGKQRTLVVQIRSDEPVPLVFKGRGNQHAHLRHGPAHLRGARPIKLTGPVYIKNGPVSAKQLQRKPLKIKLNNAKLKLKPATSYESPLRPFKYEQPTSAAIAYPPLGGEPQKLPLEAQANFVSEHFAPIHTIPAPNLALHDNHLQETYLPPQPQPYHQSGNQYKVTEETNDHTIVDPFSGAQKLFAPDPDPSLPTTQIRPATEPFNRPSNGKPLPVDVQTNFLVPAQPLVQIVGAQDVTPEIYPIQFTQQAQLQPLVTANVGAVQAAPVAIYDPTYLVTQSNQLYSAHQHQQQLFHPSTSFIQAGYVNADLTQEVASDGQILQAAKDAHNNIHPVLDSAPQFAALIAAPALGEQPAHFAAAQTAPEGGFVVSNYYDGDAQDNSQLLQAYAEEEAQRQELEAEQEQQQLLQLQEQHNHLLALQQQQQQHEHQQHQQQQQYQQQQQQQQHEQEQYQQQQQQQHEQQHYQQQQQQQQQHQHQQPRYQQQQLDPATAAFQEHERLVKQQLGGDTPLRIFVPDDEAAAADSRLQKRSDNLKKGTVEDADTASDSTASDDLFEVSSSVEVASDHNKDDKSAPSNSR